jgi:hypothetical protein
MEIGWGNTRNNSKNHKGEMDRRKARSNSKTLETERD